MGPMWMKAGALMVGLLPAAAAAAELKVVQAGPTGEVAKLEEANEVRVVFSEPMVVLGRVPEPVQAPFFRIEPALEGALRWSGTNTLIFTPRRLPYATRYTVTVDGATSVAGRRLPAPHVFSFTTPTVRLLRAEWYRKDGQAGSPVVVALRFNQPVDPLAVSRELSLQYEPHEFKMPEAPVVAPAPGEPDEYTRRVEQARAAAQARGVVAYTNAVSWKQDRYPPSPDLVVLETKEAPVPESWLKVWLSPKVRGVQGPETPGKPQESMLHLQRVFFVDGFRCRTACSPEGYNPLRLRSSVTLRALARAVTVVDVTDPAQEKPVARGKPRRAEAGEWEDRDQGTHVALEDVGYSLKPARTYRIAVDRSLTATDGQALGYTWTGTLENWHLEAFSSFGSGHGVWESRGGSVLPFYARNLRSVTQWLVPLELDEVMPTMRRLEGQNFQATPATPGEARRLRVTPDALQSHGLDLKPVLSPGGTGLAWAGLQDGDTVPRAKLSDVERKPRSTLVQVTNLGLTVKDSPQHTLVFVTRLDDGAPVAGAQVAIRNLGNEVVFSGVTDAQGQVVAPDTRLRDPEQWWDLAFVVTAEKDGDTAYVASNWHEGIEPWSFGSSFDLHEAKPLLRGTVFADRGVYKLGEEVRLKAVLRSDSAKGMGMLAGADAQVVVENSQGEEVDRRVVKLSEWSSADWAVSLPAEGPLGRYRVTARVGGQEREAYGSFLVAAYRRPEFRVDVELAGESSLAGVSLKGVATGRYLFGSPMAGQGVRWTYSKAPLFHVPPAVADRFLAEQWAFLGEDPAAGRPGAETLQTREETLGKGGQLTLDLPTDLSAGRPWQYTLEAEVTDVSRQTIAGRGSFRVDAAPFYLGLRRPGYFTEQERGVDTEIVAAGLDGRAVVGVAVEVTLTQIQWHSIRRAEGGGFYTWETERREVPAGKWEVTTAQAPAPLHVDLPSGGYFVLKATAGDGEGRSTTTTLGFYVLGAGYTAWERYDHNRIDLVPEKQTYRPGETARLMVKSPWESATALLTTEREGIRTRRTFALTSTQQTVEVPITEEDIPNVFVSVLLVRGRTGEYKPEESGDPGKPSFRLGYAELKVEDSRKALAVSVSADREEYRPGAQARVEVAVTDAAGKPAPSEVTLWAVDYGVLSLTAYRTPDVRGTVWVEKALQVMNADSRQRLISRRAIVPKGDEEGGGGGAEEGPGTPVRKDFRVLAFWLGSLPTDAQGRATATVTLPESLTTYRIMAVAADRVSRFGRGEREVRISKPVLLRAAFPRFLAVGDRAFFGAVLNSQLKEKGTAIVTMRSLDPARLEVVGESKKTVPVGPQGTVEVRFDARARALGAARVQMSVKLLGEADALEETLPVRILSSPEVVAAYGQASPDARETLELPGGVLPGFGGLQVEVASTALVGLGEGARYLVEYPYGCAEQRASATLALALAADLGEAFRLPGLAPAQLKTEAGQALAKLAEFQCPDGGFAYWAGSCDITSPYLTAYVLHVLQRGRALGHPVADSVLEKGYTSLEGALSAESPAEAGRGPFHNAWQAFAAKVLAEGGRNVDSPITRLHGQRERMPVFALAYLLDAMAARGETGPRRDELQRRLENAILPEGGTAHVEELSDPYLLWFWNSNVRSTAIVLSTLVRTGAQPEMVPRLVRWLMQIRKQGRWGNTQENARAMEALVDYYRKFEAEPPDFTAVVTLGREALFRQPFAGRSTTAHAHSVEMTEVLARGQAGERLDLAFQREGTGTLHYVARLKYAADAPELAAMDQGFQVERAYMREGTGGGPPLTSYRAGDLVKVTLTLRLTKERRFVAVSDPLPAGFEPVESWFATTASDLAQRQRDEEAGGTYGEWWRRGGFDHVERHDDRVLLFATRLSEGEHVFSYVARATTAGTFRVAPTHAEEMYEPEVFGRTSSTLVEVRP
jgi:alpha-2-macroglobulin